MSRRTTTRVTLVAASVLMVAVAPLVACTAPPTSAVRASEPAPAPATPSGSVPPSPSDVPTPTPTWPPQMALPTPPPEMSRADEAGAVATVTYFLAVYPYTEATQDTTVWEEMSHPDCVFCKSVVNDVTQRRAARRTVVPAPIIVRNRETTIINPMAYSIAANVSTGPDVLRSADGSVLDGGTVRTGTMTVVVLLQGERWIVRGVQLDPDE